MSGHEFGYKGKEKVSFPDPLFLYIEWEERAQPSNNSKLFEIIEDLNLEYFRNPSQRISTKKQTFLTFRQAEMVFNAIKDKFDFFQLEGVALASQVDSKGKITGKVSTDDAPVVSPFVISSNYDNLVNPLVEETFRDPRFQNYSYEELALYFTETENNLVDCYCASLNLSRSQAPLFPAQGTIEGELPRIDKNKNVKRAASTSVTVEEIAKRGSYYEEYEEPIKRDKLTFFFGIVGALFGTISLGVIFLLVGQLGKVAEQNQYLHSELVAVQELQANQNSVDTFGKFFVSSYYSGDKAAIDPFLAEGDVKYTQPENQTILSTILKGVTLADDGETYTLTYVVSYKNNEEIILKEISFDCKKDKELEDRWVVTSEPITKNYALLENTSSNNEEG